MKLTEGALANAFSFLKKLPVEWPKPDLEAIEGRIVFRWGAPEYSAAVYIDDDSWMLLPSFSGEKETDLSFYRGEFGCPFEMPEKVLAILEELNAWSTNVLND